MLITTVIFCQFAENSGKLLRRLWQRFDIFRQHPRWSESNETTRARGKEIKIAVISPSTSKRQQIDAFQAHHRINHPSEQSLKKTN